MWEFALGERLVQHVSFYHYNISIVLFLDVCPLVIFVFFLKCFVKSFSSSVLALFSLAGFFGLKRHDSGGPEDFLYFAIYVGLYFLTG